MKIFVAYFLTTILVRHVISKEHVKIIDCKSQEYTVALFSTNPLGLKLNGDLKIVNFVPTENGEARLLQLSNLVKIGDQMIRLNHQNLHQMSLSDAVSALAIVSTDSQKNITFMRTAITNLSCSDLKSNLDTSIRNQNELEMEQLQPGRNSVGYLIIRYKGIVEKVFGVSSAYGQSESCEIHRLSTATPRLACSPISNFVKNRFVIVQNSGGCPIHQKAIMIQKAGGVGFILAAAVGKKPVIIPKSKEFNSSEIYIPIIMVSHKAGNILKDFLVDSSIKHKHDVSVQTLLTIKCLESAKLKEKEVILQIKKANSKIQSSRSGTIALMHDSRKQHQFEFLRAGFSGDLIIGKHNVDLESRDVCKIMIKSALNILYEDSIVVASIGKCSVLQQALFFERHKAKGVIFANLNSMLPSVLTKYDKNTNRYAIPIVTISNNSYFSIMTLLQQHDATVVFENNDAYFDHWLDLHHLSNPSNWPNSVESRDRLFHRVIKTHRNIHSENSERYNCLSISYWRAQIFHQSIEPMQ